MTTVSGFPPVARADARTLILGSMPGVRSLEANEYYAHPQNTFWRIMGELLDFSVTETYARRLQVLMANRIALWDVIGCCYREGSMDAAIRSDDLEVNDFAGFFGQHRHVQSVFFNGATAERLWHRQVVPQLATQSGPTRCLRLPSTSPAYASMRPEHKLAAWSIVVAPKGH